MKIRIFAYFMQCFDCQLLVRLIHSLCGEVGFYARISYDFKPGEQISVK